MPKPRAQPMAERRNAQSHQAVLDTAESLLARSGYSSITIDQIAQHSGVSKATIYRWWPNKAAVFMELYSRLAQQVKQPPDTGSLAGDLREQLRSAFRLFRESVAGVALAGFVAEGQANPDTARMLRGEFAEQRRSLNRVLIERARARGEVAHDISAEVASDVITGAVYYGLLVGAPEFTDDRADAIVRILLGGLQVESAPQPVPARPARNPRPRNKPERRHP